jgi:hypothetical protein
VAGLHASVVRELLSGKWLCSFVSCQLVADRQASVVRELLSGAWCGSLLSCPPLLLDGLLAWESRSLASVVGDLFSGASSFVHIMPAVPGRQASVVAELLSGEWLCSFVLCQLVAGRQVCVVRELLSGAWFGSFLRRNTKSPQSTACEYQSLRSLWQRHSTEHQQCHRYLYALGSSSTTSATS